MRSVRCDVCGTKALMAASKCPKCSHPLAVRDGFGELLPLAHCPTCDSDYPLHLGACRWCGTTPAKTPIGPHVWKGVGIVAFVGLGIGAWLVRGEAPATKLPVLVTAVDSTRSADTPVDFVIPRETLVATVDTTIVDTLSSLASTAVVGTDTLGSALPASDMVARESAGAIADTASVAATGTAPATVDSTLAAVDSTPAVVDSARLREPWLPPPSVIRRAPPPAAPAPVTEVPRTAPDPTRVAVATPKSDGARTAATRAADNRARPAPTKAKATTKAVAKAPPKRAPTRVATSRASTRKVAPAPSSRSATAKAPAPSRSATAKATAPRPRATASWVNSVARGWVVVRATANGRARIIGSVGPDTRVQLGETRGGFRRIRARGLAGWVDTRASFARAPAPRRSGRLAAQ